MSSLLHPLHRRAYSIGSSDGSINVKSACGSFEEEEMVTLSVTAAGSMLEIPRHAPLEEVGRSVG